MKFIRVGQEILIVDMAFLEFFKKHLIKFFNSLQYSYLMLFLTNIKSKLGKINKTTPIKSSHPQLGVPLYVSYTFLLSKLLTLPR